jgi:hypothetical protein
MTIHSIAIAVERANSFDTFLSPFIRVCAVTAPAGERMHIQAGLSHYDTVILLQASMDLLRVVVEEEKDILSSKKILTHHMAFAIRPHVCCLSRPTLMSKILYKHVDDTGDDEHICQHLPLANLLR